MSNKLLNDVYKKVASELGLTKYQVEDAFKSQFELTSLTMAKREDIGVRHPKFGTFHVRPGRRYHIEQNKIRQNEKREQQDGED